jgi:hypothetical protein
MLTVAVGEYPSSDYRCPGAKFLINNSRACDRKNDDAYVDRYY